MNLTESPPVHRRSFRLLPKFFHPPPAAPPITDPQKVKAGYRYFQPRILFWSTIGYGMFYFVRQNLAVAMPVMETELGIGKDKLGLFLTLNKGLYGFSKFFNGVIGDRVDARKFMAVGLIASALLNLCFGLSSAVLAFGIFWMLNGWFQGMGYPPCARLLTHWFSPKEMATKMSFWNASHSIGGGAILLLCSALVLWFGNWRLCFFVPSAIAISVAVLLLFNLHDTPESVGLPEVEGSHIPEAPHESETESPAQFRRFLWDHVFSNPYIWIISAANFFVYTIRYAVFDWGPTFLKAVNGYEPMKSGWMTAMFEFAGLGGMLLTGWMTDRYFRGRAVPICVICMLLCGTSILLFLVAESNNVWLNIVLLMAIGFFVYGPQALVAVAVVNLATKRAAATAVGLTSIFGYASSVLSGWGVGVVAKNYGWRPVFICLIITAGVGALFFAAALPAKAHGYAEQPSDTAATKS